MWRCGNPECNCEGHQRRRVAGDRSGGEELVRILTPMVNEILRSKLRYSRDEWDDVRHTVFLKMFDKLHMWRADCPFCLWVKQIAIREAFNLLRLKQRLKRIPRISDDPDRIVDPKTPPLSPEVWKCIDRTLERLPDHLRLAYDLHVKQEMTIKQTATTLNKSKRAIHYWLDGVRRQLLSCLD